MKGSQALDALAALCSGTPTTTGGSNTAPANTASNEAAMNSSNNSATTAAPATAPSADTTANAATMQALGQLGANHPGLLAAAAAAQRVDPSALAMLLGQPAQAAQAAPQQQQPQQQDIFGAMHQLALQQYVQSLGAQAQQQQQQQAQQQQQNQQAALLMAAQQLQQQQRDQQQRVLPTAAPSTSAAAVASGSVPTSSSAPSTPKKMKPPPPPASSTVVAAPTPAPVASSVWNAAATTTTRILPNTAAMDDVVASSLYQPEDKKYQKRAANRRSAQLSRKRKKQFIEELKEENDDLRRKEQILRAIPDLIVVFDSSGKLGFVSESVGRFIDMSPDELMGSSFWDRLCEDSVRLLKAAFMDSLAARQADSDTAPLGSGVWELRLVDKNNNFMMVTLNGVVHFKGDVPECVCCIRPVESKIQKATKSVVAKASTAGKKLQQATKLGIAKVTARPVSSSDGSRSSDGSGNEEKGQPKELPGGLAVNPRQSVMGNTDTSSNDNTAEDEEEEEGEMDEEDEVDASAARKRRRVVAGQIVNISDGESVDVSESGSDDGVASN